MKERKNINITSQEFSNKFSLTTKEKEDLVLFSGGTEIGFSLKKEYKGDILFKPAKTKEGVDDSISMILIGYKYKQENNGLIPIHIKISKQSKYLLKGYYDYDFNDKTSPTKKSLEISKKSINPADLESYGDYFYDINKKYFIEKGNEIKAGKMIDDIYNQHIKTSHKFKGISFRSKVKIVSLIVNSLQTLITFFKGILKICFGRNLEKKGDDVFKGLFLDGYQKEDLLPTSPNKISILGFESNVTKQSFLTLCATIVIFGITNTYIFKINFERANILFENEVFLGSLAILGIFIVDNWIPYIFYWSINLLIKLKKKIMFMKLKVK